MINKDVTYLSCHFAILVLLTDFRSLEDRRSHYFIFCDLLCVCVLECVVILCAYTYNNRTELMHFTESSIFFNPVFNASLYPSFHIFYLNLLKNQVIYIVDYNV